MGLHQGLENQSAGVVSDVIGAWDFSGALGHRALRGLQRGTGGRGSGAINPWEVVEAEERKQDEARRVPV